jgi:hypothetical protein
VGHEGAEAIQTMIEGERQSRGIAVFVLGLVTVLFAASAVVSELRDVMNTSSRSRHQSHLRFLSDFSACRFSTHDRIANQESRSRAAPASDKSLMKCANSLNRM